MTKAEKAVRAAERKEREAAAVERKAEVAESKAEAATQSAGLKAERLRLWWIRQLIAFNFRVLSHRNRMLSFRVDGLEVSLREAEDRIAALEEGSPVPIDLRSMSFTLTTPQEEI